MALNIKDTKTEETVRRLSEASGETVTTAVRKAAEERLVPRQPSDRRLAQEIMDIGNRCAQLTDLDLRTQEGILGYDERGLPT